MARERTGHALLDSGQPLDPATARRLACDAGIVPAVLGTRSEPIELGRATYAVTWALRRLLIIRDRGCAHPDCTCRPNRCHAHHISPHLALGRRRPHRTRQPGPALPLPPRAP